MKSFILKLGMYAVFEVDERPRFEVLGKKYRNNDETSEEEIWIPIVEK